MTYLLDHKSVIGSVLERRAIECIARFTLVGLSNTDP